MLVKKIKYKDYNGIEREEDFYFNLNKAEIFNLQFGRVKGGLDTYIKKMIEAEDVPSLINLFEDLVLSAYGEKSEDGKRFIKNDMLREEFKQTEAYSELIMELVQDDKVASDFINALVPKDLADEANKKLSDGGELNGFADNN